MSSVITPELLDAMLTAGPQRSDAERAFTSVPIPDRASGLASLLLRSDISGAGAGRAMLAAVLLRRDASALGGAGAVSGGVDTGASLELLRGMSGPLLGLFLDAPSSSSSVDDACRVRRQIGHCVAEICLSLSLLSSADGDAAMGTALNGIGPACAACDIPALRLLADLADRSPLALWRASGTNGDALLSVLQSSVGALQSAGGSVEMIEAILEAVVKSAIASHVAAKSTADSESNELLLMLKAQADDAVGARDARVDPKSFAATLGRSCLPPLLSALEQAQSGSVEARRRCTQLLSRAASHCPSLLAGDVPTLTCLVRTCLSLGRLSAGATDGDEANAALSALEVLASACNVEDVRRRIVLTSAMGGATENLLQLLLLGEGTTGLSDKSGVLRICAEYIVNGTDEDAEGWASDPASLQEDASSWDGDDAAVYAESLLELYIRHLGGGAASLPAVLPLVETLLSSPSDQWRNHRAALSVLERCLEGAPVTFAAHVPIAIDTALKLAGHPCPRVQFQAIQLLGALCNCDAVDGDGVQVRAPNAGRIMKALSAAVKSPCSKVSAHASLALVSYCRGGNGREDCGQSVDGALLVPYLPDVLAALASGPLAADVSDPSVVGWGGVTVLVRAISAVACLADAAGEDFAPHYSSIMPGLLGCARFGLNAAGLDSIGVAPNASGHDFAVLRGSALESATIVGQAVGSDNPDAYIPDAEAIVQIILPLLKMAESGADSSAIVPMDQLLAGSARIASVMGDRYAPFVPAVLPHLLKRAREQAEMSVIEGDEAGLEATKRGEFQQNEEHGTESVTVALPGMGIRKLIMNTTQMQEKAQAARAVYEHANAMGTAFGPHAEACLSAFLPLIEFKYSAEVRSTSAQAVGQVFNTLCEYSAVEKSAAALPNQVLPSVAKAISKQLQVEDAEDQETVFALADSLSEVFYSAFRHKNDTGSAPVAVLGAGEARQIVAQVIEIAKACLERRYLILRAISGVDGAAPDEDEMAMHTDQLQSEADQLTELVNTIGYNIKSLREAFAPIFDQIVAPFLSPLLTSHDVRARLAAVCLFVDSVEYCGDVAATRYTAPLAEAAVKGLNDLTNEGDSDLKSVSVYGITQIARHAPRGVLDWAINDIMSQLIQIVHSADGQSKDDMDDTCLVETAVSAIASLAIFETSPYASSGAFDKPSLMNMFLGSLPLREDESDARVCHEGLCDLVESHSIDVAAEPERLVQVISQIFALVDKGEEVASAATCARLAAILKKIQEVSIEAVQSAFAALSPEVQTATNKALERQGVGRGSSPVSVSRLS